MPDKRKHRNAPPLPVDEPPQRREDREREIAAAEIKRIKALLRNRPPFRDERLAPDIDQQLLLALVRDELPERTARDVYRFVISFKSWSDAYCELLVREYHATQRSSINRH